ncbi:MAG: glycosyltransferase [Bacteroidota bacterium]
MGLRNRQLGKLKLSVALITYNHERYIEKALSSILTQETDFDFEIVIGDDGSTDSTQDILLNFADQNPDKIKLVFNERNEGVFSNVYNTVEACTGKYLAFLEGDDFWVYPKKLQQQVDFLESNPEYSGCFHDAQLNWDKDLELKSNEVFTGLKTYSQLHHYPEEITTIDLVNRTVLPTSAIMFRNRDFLSEFMVFKEIKYSLSWALGLILIKNDTYNSGLIKYFNEVWSAHLKHKEGLTVAHKRSLFIESNIMILNSLRHDPYYRNLTNVIRGSKISEYQFLMDTLENRSIPNKLNLAIRYFILSIKYAYVKSLKFLFQARSKATSQP